MVSSDAFVGVVDDQPTGAKISWSKHTRCSAGTVALCLVIGNDRDKNANHWNCTGDIMKPYDMHRVKRSKSNGGGPGVRCGMMYSDE